MSVYLIHIGFDNFKIPYIGEVISLNYMSSLLKTNGHVTRVIDCLLEGISHKDLENEVLDKKPSVLVLSFYEANQEECFQLIRTLRSKGFFNPIIFVGIYVTLNTNYLLNKVDDIKNVFCIRGEPEEVIVEFANKIKNCTHYPKLDNIAYKEGNTIFNEHIVNSVKDINLLPFPDCSVMDRIYKKSNVSSYILSSRGCYGNCSFCILNLYNSCITIQNRQKKWRERNVSSVVDEMEMLARRYPDVLIKFADSNFIGSNPSRAFELSQELRSRNVKCKFAIECRANDVEMESFKALRDAGLVSVFLGIESGSADVLKRYNKEISIQQNQIAINIIRELKIGLKMGFILFDEYSTIGELEENTSFLHRNNSCVFHPYRPLIIEKYRVNGVNCSPILIRDDKTRMAYDIIKITCEEILPYRALLDKHRKYCARNHVDYRNSVRAILEKFIMFDKYGMNYLLDMCKNNCYSYVEVKENFMCLLMKFLIVIKNDLEKLEMYR